MKRQPIIVPGLPGASIPASPLPSSLEPARFPLAPATPPQLEGGLRAIFLRPGELAVCYAPCLVTTLLGSCVAVTLFSARLRLGAICHGLLAAPRDGSVCDETHPRRFHYLSCAIPVMAGAFRSLGIRPDEMEVKLFGGGNVIAAGRAIDTEDGIGSTNVAAARQLLHAEGLTIKAASVGGVCGRKLLFNTLTGRVLLKRLGASARNLLLKS